jgi:hypothetical protein
MSGVGLVGGLRAGRAHRLIVIPQESAGLVDPTGASGPPAAPNRVVVTSVCHGRQQDPRPTGLGSATGGRFL